MEQKAIALSMTAKEWVGLLSSNEQQKAAKALNYLDGKQEEEVIKILNDPNSGRTQWKQKGFIPRYRNLTRMIVEKSALLFNDNLPTFELYNDTTENTVDTQKLYNELNKIPFQEIMNNADQVLRMLKSVLMLFQYDTDTNELVIDILHRGNSQVVVDGSKQMIGLIYTTSEGMYRIFTKEQIIDLMVTDMNEPVVTNTQPNIYGIVPATMFYDLRIPRNGIWYQTEYDLINFNEAYNLHLTDSDYSMKWSKLPSLVLIDCEVSSNSGQMTQEVLNYGDTLPRTIPAEPSVSGGPGSIIQLISNGQSARPSVDYKAPSPDIKGMDDVYTGWGQAIAKDWSVRLKADGEGTASSGFQVIVEEISNLELRKQRQKMYQGGFKRAWKVIRQVLNVSSPVTFNENTVMFVEFSDPQLPVDQGSQEDVWDKRINGGRATILDYFRTELGLTDEEAIDKFKEILMFETMKRELQTVVNTQPVTIDDSENPIEDSTEDPSDDAELKQVSQD